MSSTVSQEFLMGNSAMARGMIESGCEIATAYPGTPSTEILEEVIRLKQKLRIDTYVEWSVNEKVAFDVAYAAAMAGKRAVVSMKQVGLNVASDSLLSAVYTGVVGGLVVIPCDDPGPLSSQTEQDSRLFSIFAKIPSLDPSTPQEALDMIKYAFELSERFGIPVMVRPTTRLCHGSATVTTAAPLANSRPARFKKDPHRWAATPAHRLRLHRELEDKLLKIKEEFESNTRFNRVLNDGAESLLGLICSGISYATLHDLLLETGLSLSILKIGTVHPLPLKLVEDFVGRFQYVMVVEEPDRAVEIQIRDRRRVLGRETGHIPPAGELTPEVVHRSLRSALLTAGAGMTLPEASVPELPIDVTPPSLCPGCGHRAAFFSIRKAKTSGIFPSDIGCYTLGLNMKAVDTCLDMGAGITIADGLAKAYAKDGENVPVIATIGDSTFFHAGVPGLLNACTTGSAFVLVILDNGIVAMTGFQTTPAGGQQADGRAVPRVSIRDLVKACGVEFIEEMDPYHVQDFMDLIKRAREYSRSRSKVAVVIAKHPCVLHSPNAKTVRVKILDTCDGCEYCLKFFECQALKMDEGRNKVFVDYSMCVDCGVCIDSCPQNVIVPDL